MSGGGIGPGGTPIGGREDRDDAALYRPPAAHFDVSGDQLAHPICDVAVVFVTAAEDSVVRAAHTALGVEDRVVRDPAEVEGAGKDREPAIAGCCSHPPPSPGLRELHAVPHFERGCSDRE